MWKADELIVLAYYYPTIRNVLIYETTFNYCLLRCHRKNYLSKKKKKVHSFPVIKFTNFISVLPLSPATTLTLWHRCDNKYSSKGSHWEFEKWTLNELIIPKNKVTTRWEGPQSLSYHQCSMSKVGTAKCYIRSRVQHEVILEVGCSTRLY